MRLVLLSVLGFWWYSRTKVNKKVVKHYLFVEVHVTHISLINLLLTIKINNQILYYLMFNTDKLHHD